MMYKIITLMSLRSSTPLWNETRFCERAIATSRAFTSVIKADHADWYEGVFDYLK
jgi:hypothetical protein